MSSSLPTHQVSDVHRLAFSQSRSDRIPCIPLPALGYNPTAVKSLDEYANLDAEDESLARWKASLGILPGGASSSAPAGQKVGTISIHHLDSI